MNQYWKVPYLKINTETTGFCNPARDYVDKRLDINDLIIQDNMTTFFFKYAGQEKLGVRKGDILVVDRSKPALPGDIIIEDNKITLNEFKNQSIWGVVTWVLSQRKK